MASGYFYFTEMFAAQKTKFSIKDFVSKCGKKFILPENVRKRISGVSGDIELRIWSHLLKESLMENFIFCARLQL